jgi:hypothetical protein
MQPEPSHVHSGQKYQLFDDWLMCWSSVQVAVFEGSCYTTPIIGALLADSVWGRYKTILVFSVVYLLVRQDKEYA